jgi:hypothetical protein
MNCNNKMEKVVPKTLQIRRIGFCGAGKKRRKEE